MNVVKFWHNYRNLNFLAFCQIVKHITALCVCGGDCMLQTQLLAVVVFYIKHENKLKLLFYRGLFSKDTVHILHVYKI